MIERSKQLVRPLRHSRPVVAAVESIGARQYQAGRPGGLVDRAIARLLTLNAPAPELRAKSVDALVELFFEIVEVTEVERFVEAGAKDAGASVRTATSTSVREVVAFEANPYTHRRFAKTVTEKGVDYRHLALTEESGDVVFLVRLTPEGRPMADGQASLLVRPDHEPGYEEVTVTGMRLDEALGVTEVITPTALWIDVEGASAQVLRGASTLMRSVEVAIIEVESDRRWEGQEWVDHDVIEFFVSAGLEPIARDRQSRLQYNIVFARADRPAVQAAVRDWRSRSN